MFERTLGLVALAPFTVLACAGSEPIAATHEAEAEEAASAPAARVGREQLLELNRAVFDARKNGVQAALGDGVTESNWSTFATKDTWGPHAKTFGPLGVAPPSGADATAAQQELFLAVVNYWVEQGINYCHHHIPGWTPPNEGAYRNSTGGSTSGSKAGQAMTCTANRYADGRQRTAAAKCTAKDAAYCDSPDELASSDPSKQVQWNGVDCSDFTSWAYNFAGMTSSPLPTAIGVQACEPSAAGELLAAGDPSDFRPGDLLFIKAVGSSRIAHVITWTGLRWNDLAGPGFDPSKLGEPGSRLGGDLYGYGIAKEDMAKVNPYMIVDSHYAGPAYRPFTGWYQHSLSHVRRILGPATSDPTRAPQGLKLDATTHECDAP